VAIYYNINSLRAINKGSPVEVGRFVPRRVLPTVRNPSVEVPELLTVREVASLLKLSHDSITRRFENYPGVMGLGSPETRFKRAYKVLRIPRPLLQKYLQECKVSETLVLLWRIRALAPRSCPI
jgi:hypothetical protein